jgi:hypothetical protein
MPVIFVFIIPDMDWRRSKLEFWWRMVSLTKTIVARELHGSERHLECTWIPCILQIKATGGCYWTSAIGGFLRICTQNEFAL